MSDIKTDIMVGLKYLKGDDCSGKVPKGYNEPFSRTNEDMDTYFSKFPITNGIVATVAGSGDQQLQIAKDNPKEIHVFDKNPLAIHMAKLKTAGCLALSHEMFKNFFDEQIFSDKTYNMKTYKIIRDYLDKDCRKYWDAMYKKGKYEKRYSRLVSPGDFLANRGPNSYEREENFYKTKSNLEKMSIYYYCAEFYIFFNQIVKDKKFDAIFLSNIYDWLEGEEQNNYANYIKNELSRLITQNGMITAYSSVKNCGLYNDLEKEFPEYYDMNGDDKVLIYRKN